MLSTLTPQLYLGIDAGGSHTEAVITDESGFILARSLLNYGANPHNVSPVHTYEALLKVANSARASMHMKHKDRALDQNFDQVCVGMSGFDSPSDVSRIRSFIQKLDKDSPVFNCKKISFVHNGLITLKSGTEKNYGVSITIGTGAHCYGVAGDGREATAGGWGHLLGDQGSGYWIGRSLLRQVMREYDGRSAKTPITDKVLAALALKSPEELIGWIYASEGLPVREIAQLSYVVNDPALMHSLELSKIINESVADIVDAYKTIISRLDLKKSNHLPVVIAGGLMKMKGSYAERVMQEIRNITPQADIILPTMTPSQGAIRLIQSSQHGDVLPHSALTIINPQPMPNPPPKVGSRSTTSNA